MHVRGEKRRRVTLTGIKLKSIGIEMNTIYKRSKVTSRIFFFFCLIIYYVSDNIYHQYRNQYNREEKNN